MEVSRGPSGEAMKKVNLFGLPGKIPFSSLVIGGKRTCITVFSTGFIAKKMFFWISPYISFG